MNELQAICAETIEAWDNKQDISAFIEKIRFHLVVSSVEDQPSKKKKTGGGKSSTLPALPAFAEPYREQLQSWWELRKQQHKSRAVDAISKRTISALENARDLDVLEEFCNLASEASWLSLGFAGHTEMLEKLARDKTFKPSSVTNKGGRGKFNGYQRQAEVEMVDHPAYKPLLTDTDVFF
jgi:hypothetical protein